MSVVMRFRLFLNTNPAGRGGQSTEVGHALIKACISKVSLRASHGVFPRDRWLCVLPRWT